MNIYELINKRSSIRSFKKEPVQRDTILRIVEAARLAPSWANKQCWRFVIIDSHVEKNIISKAVAAQEAISRACQDAPCLIVLCVNPVESGVRAGLEYFMFDCALAVENLMLAAVHEGLSTCIVGAFNEGTVRGLLNVPDDYRVAAIMPVGYANEEAKTRKRKKLEEVVFHNHWGKTFGEAGK